MRTLIFLFIIASVCTVGCSKKTIDPTEQLFNTNWSGTFTNPGETLSRVLCLSFGADDNVVWQDMNSTNVGKWTLTNGLLVITFNKTSEQKVFKLTGNQMEEPESGTAGEKKISRLSKITTAPEQVSGSQWLNEAKWLIRFEKSSVILFQPKSISSIGGGGQFVLKAPVLSMTDGQIGNTKSAAFFGVFISDRILIGNFKTGQRLDAPPFISEQFYEYIKQ